MSTTAPKVIESPKNPLVKALAKLKDRRARDQEKRYLIEGSKEITRAFEAQKPLEQLFYCPDLVRNEGRAILNIFKDKLELFELSEAAFSKLSMRQNPDGLIALARFQTFTLNDINLPHNALVLVIDGLEKPGNVGALLRTSDAVKVDAVFLTGKGTDIYNPNVIRSSVGSVFSQPVLTVDTNELISYLRDNDIRILATSPEASKTYWNENLTQSTAIILGTEHEGLGRDWLETADAKVGIPMHGKADSLNVATSGALLLYEALRQRS